MIIWKTVSPTAIKQLRLNINGLVQERHNSIGKELGPDSI